MRIVTVGGGTGSFVLLSGLKNILIKLAQLFPWRMTEDQPEG